MARGITYLSMMSEACRNGLPELCQDGSCENWEHAPDGSDVADLTPEQDDVTWLAADDRAKRWGDRA
jgi:hypothetical protein